VTFANLARKKAAKEQIVLIPEWQNIVNFADSFDPIVRREVNKINYLPIMKQKSRFGTYQTVGTRIGSWLPGKSF